MGKLALSGIHADGTPVGVWFDAFWASYVDYAQNTTKEQSEALDEFWTELTSRPTTAAPLSAQVSPEVDDNGRPVRRRPTQAERDAWGTSAAAQQGMAALMGELPLPQQQAPVSS